MSGNFLGKALIVDDEIIDRRTLKTLLTKLNYETVEATNGQEAIDLFKLEQPTIVFMDIMMPKVDGYEATRQIKAAAGESLHTSYFSNRIHRSGFPEPMY